MQREIYLLFHIISFIKCIRNFFIIYCSFYFAVNIKKIGTITVREKLPQDSKKTDVSNSYSAVSSTKINKNEQPMNEQIDEVDFKNIKSFNHKK